MIIPMKKRTKQILTALSLLSLGMSIGHSQAIVYSTDFDGFVSGTNYIAGVAEYSYGFDADGSASDTDGAKNNFKALAYGQWGRGSNTNADFIDVGGGDIEARPNIDTANNAKLIGTFVDPALFNATGSGSYTFSVDYTGADSGAAFVFLYKASGYDTTGTNMLAFDGANGGFGSFDPFFGTGTTVVSEVLRYDIVDETANETITHTFNYTAGETIGIAFGAYNTAGTFDNVSISAVPEPSTYAVLAGVLAFAALLFRRCR